jgi:hypothetical protein
LDTNVNSSVNTLVITSPKYEGSYRYEKGPKTQTGDRPYRYEKGLETQTSERSYGFVKAPYGLGIAPSNWTKGVKLRQDHIGTNTYGRELIRNQKEGEVNMIDSRKICCKKQDYKSTRFKS